MVIFVLTHFQGLLGEVLAFFAVPFRWEGGTYGGG
jgi:hypothetical protein